MSPERARYPTDAVKPVAPKNTYKALKGRNTSRMRQSPSQPCANTHQSTIRYHPLLNITYPTQGALPPCYKYIAPSGLEHNMALTINGRMFILAYNTFLVL